MRKQNIIRADERTYASEILYGQIDVHINEAGEALGGGAVHATISSYYHNGSFLDGILGTRASTLSPSLGFPHYNRYLKLYYVYVYMCNIKYITPLCQITSNYDHFPAWKPVIVKIPFPLINLTLGHLIGTKSIIDRLRRKDYAIQHLGVNQTIEG